MRRKGEKPYFSRHAPYSQSMPKRRRPLPDPAPEATADDGADKHTTRPPPPCAVVVMSLPLECSVLDLKSRFEIYGTISRIRIDRDGVGYITYRNKESADAAIAAALDPSFGITVSSKRVQVLWATDPLAMWREGVGNSNKEKGSRSKLVRAEIPLSRHGRAYSYMQSQEYIVVLLEGEDHYRDCVVAAILFEVNSILRWQLCNHLRLATWAYQ